MVSEREGDEVGIRVVRGRVEVAITMILNFATECH